MQIRAAVMRGGSRIEIEPIEMEDPRDDEIVVRVVAAGVCHTDLKIISSGIVQVPIVLGHEGAGVVEQVGRAVRTVKPGDSVVMTFDSCGLCRCCAGRRPSYCSQWAALNFGGTRLDRTRSLSSARGPLQGHFFGQSSFASHALCHQRNVVKVPDRLGGCELAVLAPMGCGVQTGVGAVFNALKVAHGSSFAVFGAGAVGLSAVLAAKAAGASTIIAIDFFANRLDLALEYGATHVIDAGKTDALAEIFAIVPDGVETVLDATGSVPAIEQGMRALAVGGVCGLTAGLPPGETARLDVSNLMRGARSIRGMIEGDSLPEEFIPRLIDMHFGGQLPIERMIRYYNFEQIEQAFADAQSGLVIKPVLLMN